MKEIDIRDTKGRQSGFTVYEGQDRAVVRGVLEHGTEFTKGEMMRLAYQIATTCGNTFDTDEERAKLNCRIKDGGR